MSSVQDDPNPFAPPRAEVGDVATAAAPSAPVLASRWLRFGGSLIDGVILLVVLFVVSRLTPWNAFGDEEASYFAFTPLDAVLGFVAWVVVDLYPLVTGRQTWGKKILGMRIVRPDGSSASLGRIVGLRYGVPSLFYVMPALGQAWGILDALFILRASHRCLHDSIADTIVVLT
jgi:uncharacterized RDD family membrane protein YckC